LLLTESHAGRVNTLCEENAAFLNINARGTYIYHCAMKGCKRCEWLHVDPKYDIENRELNSTLHFTPRTACM